MLHGSQLCQWLCLFVKCLVLVILGDQGGDVVKALAPVRVRVPGAAATKMDIGIPPHRRRPSGRKQDMSGRPAHDS